MTTDAVPCAPDERSFFIFVSRGRVAEADADMVSFRQLFAEPCRFRRDRLVSARHCTQTPDQMRARSVTLLDFTTDKLFP